ncbi:unnamed protein product [Taenia asiatica]|uniref:Uncharacterized protein n=1 Tax=Taenia asiatica TaxID=60517 RepID=A0A0R3W9N9_TAEAS|nr:unnamed protein product [Taenia asiatica]
MDGLVEGWTDKKRLGRSSSLGNEEVRAVIDEDEEDSTYGLHDRPKSINSTLESMEEPTSTSLSPGDELSPPHLLPKAKNFASSRLEFSGKPILTGKHLSKQRSRRIWLNDFQA